MALMHRIGIYGSYYGDEKDSSHYLNDLQKNENAIYIKTYLQDKGWSIYAICGILGNMEVESTLNPGCWEGNDVGETSNGYGLVQWTPATKYQSWVPYVEDYSTMDQNLDRIIYELENNIQWIKTDKYPMSFKEFSVGTGQVTDFAYAFAYNYERPASVGVNRANNALKWYAKFGGIDSVTKSKFTWALYARKFRERNNRKRNNV